MTNSCTNLHRIRICLFGYNILNSFNDLHYGTFGGLPTRILYVFVGVAPLVLFVTVFFMWWYRYRTKSPTGFIKRFVLK
ncbi:PepSY domain-containing protein [Nostoc sp.]